MRFKEEEMSLTSVLPGEEYIIRDINTGDEELEAFLFSLGCLMFNV